MERYISLLIAVLISFSLLAQERLTDHIGGGTNLNHFLKTIDNVNYLLEVDQNDILSVYELAGVNSKSLIHSKKILGLYSEDYPRFHSDRLLYGINKKYYNYNFVSNHMDSLVLPDGYAFSSQELPYDGTSLIIARDKNDNSIYLVYHPDRPAVVLDTEKSYTGIFDEHVLEFIRHEFDNYSYVLHNFITNKVDTLLSNTPLLHNPIYEEGLFYFVGDTKEVVSFNPVSGERLILPNVFVQNGQINGLKLKIVDSLLVLEYQRSTPHEFGSQTEIRIYNLNDLDLVNELAIKSALGLNVIAIHESVLVAENKYDKLLLFNYETAESYLVDTKGLISSKLLEDKYLLHLEETEYGDEVSLKLLDINTFQSFDLELGSEISSFKQTGITEFGDQALVLLSNRIHDLGSLINLDLPSKTAQFNTILDDSDSGFSQSTNLIPFKSGVIVKDDYIYYHTGKELIVLTEGDDRDFEITADKIYYNSLDRTQLLSYDGQSEAVVLDSFKRHKDFKISEDQLYLYEGNTVSSYNLSTGETIVLDDNAYDAELEVFNNQLIYLVDSVLIRVAPTQTLDTLMDDFLNPRLNNSKPLKEVESELLIPTKSGLARLKKDGQLDYIKKGAFFNDYFASYLVNDSDKDLIFGDSDSTFHYDGNTISELELGTDGITFFQTLGADYFTGYSTVNGFTNGFMYDPIKKVLTEPPFDEGYLGNYFLHKGVPKALVLYSIGRGVLRFELYDTDSEFTAPVLSMEFPEVIGSANKHVAFIANNGLMMVGSSLYKFRIDGSFEEVDFVKMIASSIDFIQTDSLIYFLGRDVQKGIQLYSYNPNFSNIENVELSMEQLSVFPNPVEDELNLAPLRTITHNSSPQYKIYSMQGVTVLSGQWTNTIDVSSLLSGVYVIVLNNKGHIYTSKFIKE